LRIGVSGFMVDEGGVVGSKFGAEGAIEVDVGGFSLLIEEQVLSTVHVVAV